MRRIVSEGEVDVDLLGSVGALSVDNLFLLVLITLLLFVLLVGGGFLPLGISFLTFSSLPGVELGTLLLRLLSFPLIQSQSLGFLRDWFLVRSSSIFLGLTSLLGSSFLSRGVGRLLTLSLDIILKVSPVSFAASSSLLLGLDTSPGVSRLPVELSLATSTSRTSSTTSSTATASSTTSTTLSIIITSHVTLAVSLVV